MYRRGPRPSRTGGLIRSHAPVALAFPKRRWSEAQARSLLAAHGLAGPVESLGSHWRVTLRNPAPAERTFRGREVPTPCGRPVVIIEPDVPMPNPLPGDPLVASLALLRDVACFAVASFVLERAWKWVWRGGHLARAQEGSGRIENPHLHVVTGDRVCPSGRGSTAGWDPAVCGTVAAVDRDAVHVMWDGEVLAPRPMRDGDLTLAGGSRRRPNPPGIPGTGTVCVDDEGHRARCAERDARPTGQIMYRPRLPDGSRPRVYLDTDAQIAKLGEAQVDARIQAGDRALTAWRPAPRGRPSTDGLEGLDGSEVEVYVGRADGGHDTMASTYRLVERDLLLPSHDPATFGPSEGYPEGVQTRDYSLPGEHMKVLRNATGFQPRFVVNTNPDAMHGPPVVMVDPEQGLGIVLGGNSRVMTIGRIYVDPDLAPRADAYRALLRKSAPVFGFTPGDVDGLDEPVLVRVIDPPSREGAALRDLVHRFNEVFTMALDPVRELVALSHRVSDRAVALLAEGVGEGETLAQHLASERSRDFVGELRRTEVIPESQAPRYIGSDGLLNDAGKDLAHRVLLGLLVPDPAVIEGLADKAEALSKAVPYIMAAAGVGGQWDMRAEMAEAVKAWHELGRRGLDRRPTAAGLDNARKLVGQLDLFEGVRPHIVGLLLETFMRRGGVRQFPAGWRNLAAIAAQNPPGQRDLLGGTSVDEALALAFGEAP